jgi:hypothetical protein
MAEQINHDKSVAIIKELAVVNGEDFSAISTGSNKMQTIFNIPAQTATDAREAIQAINDKIKILHSTLKNLMQKKCLAIEIQLLLKVR